MIRRQPLRRLAERFAPRVNRVPSPVLATAVPWVTVMLGSMSPTVPIIASAPLLPPFGLLMLVAWRQVRPGLLPIWAGLPLGAFDDIYSGQPFGSAILLWSLSLIALEYVETRYPWRTVLASWAVAAALLFANLAAGLAIANLAGGAAPLQVIVPQALIAILLYPAASRFAAMCDRFRLLPIVELS